MLRMVTAALAVSFCLVTAVGARAQAAASSRKASRVLSGALRLDFLRPTVPSNAEQLRLHAESSLSVSRFPSAAELQDPPRAQRLCPMPVVRPDTTSLGRMPVDRRDSTHTATMPVAKGCENPLFR